MGGKHCYSCRRTVQTSQPREGGRQLQALPLDRGHSRWGSHPPLLSLLNQGPLPLYPCQKPDCYLRLGVPVSTCCSAPFFASYGPWAPKMCTTDYHQRLRRSSLFPLDTQRRVQFPCCSGRGLAQSGTFIIQCFTALSQVSFVGKFYSTDKAGPHQHLGQKLGCCMWSWGKSWPQQCRHGSLQRLQACLALGNPRIQLR